jgi:hypothetical protein
LPESAEVFSPTSSLDTRQLSLLSGIPTPAESFENVPQMDGFPVCECGKEMSDCSIHPSTPAAWIASMRDSLARTLVSLESRQAYLREPDQVFTEKSCALLTRYDRDTYSWRTLQQSFLTDSEPYSETWPRWGMTRDGAAYAHPMSERRITGIDGGVWQTPVADDSIERKTGKWNSRGEPKLSAQVKIFPTPTSQDNPQVRGVGKTIGTKRGTTLGGFVRMWPTPAARDYKGQNSVDTMKSKLDNGERAQQGQLPNAVAMDGDIGQLNPNWVGWLMGFPMSWAKTENK